MGVHGATPSFAALPVERLSALLAHGAFGYTERDESSCAEHTHPAISSTAKQSPGVDEAAVGRSIGGAPATAELEERKAALQAQLVELEEALKGERESTAEINDAIRAMQERMGAAVDEHGTLNRSLADATARAAELASEADRLRASLGIREGQAPNTEQPDVTEPDDG